MCFKHYYKLNTLNTSEKTTYNSEIEQVLNLVISGIPSIQSKEMNVGDWYYVLNLVINGIPSIQTL